MPRVVGFSQKLVSTLSRAAFLQSNPLPAYPGFEYSPQQLLILSHARKRKTAYILHSRACMRGSVGVKPVSYTHLTLPTILLV
eukprot:740613-Amphidinium_carterae.1